MVVADKLVTVNVSNVKLDVFNKENYNVTPSFSITLKPWGYKILVKK